MIPLLQQCPFCNSELLVQDNITYIVGVCPQHIYPAPYKKYPGPEYSYWLEKEATYPYLLPYLAEQYCFNDYHNEHGYVLSALINYELKHTKVGYFLMSQDNLGSIDDEILVTTIEQTDYLPLNPTDMLARIKLLLTFQ